MATRYIAGVKEIKYGTPTGTNTLPGTMTALPKTVKGSVAIDETEGSYSNFFTDQDKNPIRSIKSEEGITTITAQFYDMDATHLAVFKGGTANSGVFIPSEDYTNVNMAITMEFDTGQTFKIYNGNCSARLTGGGGRDKMLAWELKITVQATLDGAGSAEY